MNNRFRFGLVGKNISYSFSQKYFTEKFEEQGLTGLRYDNIDIPLIEEFPFVIYQKEEDFKGFNVTIPYKQSIIKYLDNIDDMAKEIGAVNTIKVSESNELIGYNTDVYGFQKSIEPLLQAHHKKALILGTGGASKAVAFGLKVLNIETKFVSRTSSDHSLLYSVLDRSILEEYTVIVNCTPVGTYPNIEDLPSIPYQYLSEKHIVYDLIYNPSKTAFLKAGKQEGAVIKNGLEMLELQAEKSWEIWNS
jgi:shikimate dehydrogenase